MTKTSFTLTEETVSFINDRLGVDYTGGCDLALTVWNDAGKVVLGVICEFKTEFDVHMTVACDDPKAVTRRMLRAVFKALFSKAKRITALIEPENRHCVRLARRLGFKDEGYGRLLIEGKRNALIFGMLECDCVVFKGTRRASVPRETKVAQNGFQPETPGPLQDR